MPEQIQYRLKLEENPVQVSYATIYRALNGGLIEILLAVKTPNETAKAQLTEIVERCGLEPTVRGELISKVAHAPTKKFKVVHCRCNEER